MKFTRSPFASNGSIVLADLVPLDIKRGHITLNLPSNEVKLVAVQITNEGLQPQHAAIINLTETFSPRLGETIYQSDLDSTVVGLNPFTGQNDTVSKITNLLVWNNDTNEVPFNDDHSILMTMVGIPSMNSAQQPIADQGAGSNSILEENLSAQQTAGNQSSSPFMSNINTTSGNISFGSNPTEFGPNAITTQPSNNSLLENR